MFGLFLGVSIVIFAWILGLFIIGELNPEEETEDGSNVFNRDFPMFRGALLLILSNWLIGLNVYVWNNVHVNYKAIFKFDSHHSEITQIF